MAKLNCLIPVYNASQYLEESLESIRSQSFQDFEILAFNDGSEDDSLAILEKIKLKESRLHIFSEEHSFGIPYALNQLMKISKAPFFAFQGANDLSHPKRFEKQMQQMKSSSLIALGSSITVDGTPIGKEILKKEVSSLPRQILKEQTATTHHHGMWVESGLYSKKIRTKPIEFDETMPALYDLLFSGEIQHYFPLRISNIPDFLYTKRLYPGCLEEKISQKKIRIDFEQIENFFITKLMHVYSRYIEDAQLTPAVNPY